MPSSTQEAEPGGSLYISGQTVLFSKVNGHTPLAKLVSFPFNEKPCITISESESVFSFMFMSCFGEIPSNEHTGHVHIDTNFSTNITFDGIHERSVRLGPPT